MRVLAIGRPMLFGPSAVICRAVDQIVVSVGPYMFQASQPVATMSARKLSLSASPPQTILTPSSLRQPERNSMLHVAGVACITVGLIEPISRLSFSTSPATPLAQTWQGAPPSHGPP